MSSRHTRSFFGVMLAVVFALSAVVVAPASAKLTKHQKAHIRHKLMRQIKHNPKLIRNKRFIKKGVTVLAEREGTDEVKYITGNVGRGTFTWYGGHDPEDYQHAVNDPPTDLSLHKSSPGYRLILNNVLFPSAKKKKQKT